MARKFVVNILDWGTTGFDQEKVDKHSHDNTPAAKENKNPIFHMAKHGKEALADDEGKKEVDARVKTISSGSSLKG